MGNATQAVNELWHILLRSFLTRQWSSEPQVTLFLTRIEYKLYIVKHYPGYITSNLLFLSIWVRTNWEKEIWYKTMILGINSMTKWTKLSAEKIPSNLKWQTTAHHLKLVQILRETAPDQINFESTSSNTPQVQVQTHQISEVEKKSLFFFHEIVMPNTIEE